MHTIFSVGLCLFCWTVFTQAGTPLFLTPYIKHGNAEMGKRLSRVDPEKFLNVTSYSGYITVDESHDSNLFFWYFPAVNLTYDISNTPLIIWLQGGPGGTSLFGTFMEIGPFSLKQYNETYTQLQLRSSSWGNRHSLLFIDNPVEAGFSFTRDSNGYPTNLDTCAEHLYSFLQQFLTVFPELRAAPLFIAGESYAGRFVPAFAKKVHDTKESKNRKINLQGLIMGNPFITRTDAPNITQIFYQWGLIDQQGALAAKELQDSYLVSLKNNDTRGAFDLWNRLLDKLQELSLQPQLYNVLQYKTLDTHVLVEYINSEKFKEDIHVRNNTIPLVNHIIHIKLLPDFLRNMDSTMNELLEHYRVLIYCGQLDMIEPCVPNSEARRKNWRWSLRQDFLSAHRKPLLTPTISGYFKSGGGLTEVLISGSGHLVPIDKPDVAQTIVSYFIDNEELPTDRSIVFNDDLPDLDKISDESNKNQELVNGTNVINTVSWVLNGILITVIIAAAVLYVRQRRRTHDYMMDDEDSLDNAVLSMS